MCLPQTFKILSLTDNIVLLKESREAINFKLRKHILEIKGFHLSRSKTKYLHCNFSESIGIWQGR